MQNTINHELAHTYIIKELAYRTLNYDLQHLEKLKSKTVLTKMFNVVVKDLNKELATIRKGMQLVGLKLHEEFKIDELFTAYTFVQKGITEELRYSNHALKNQTMIEIERLFNIETQN